MPTGAELLREAAALLEKAGVEGAMGDARLLLAHALRVERSALIHAVHDELDPVVAARFFDYVSARASHQPLAQIRGWRDFWGRKMRVTPDVLDPRPDSETLIEIALGGTFQTVLDLGTGSGALVVTLLAERSNAQGVAIDISPAALDVARANALAHGVAARLDLRISDWFEAIDGRYDLIICNPPYIDADEWARLSTDVRAFEPKIALTPGPDGLAPYRHISTRLEGFLTPAGRAVFEIGHQQGAAVVAIFQTAGFTDVTCIQDINGKDRVILVQNCPKSAQKPALR
ncbi:MAG: peptide chain release factor N(5)-glutamine methyltransferase [Paracoccaceae bacterium]